jgi:hypothetical protein
LEKINGDFLEAGLRGLITKMQEQGEIAAAARFW